MSSDRMVSSKLRNEVLWVLLIAAAVAAVVFSIWRAAQ
jgi:hypothetical protein